MAEENASGGGGGSGTAQVIVVKKKNRGGHGGHHGGAWKVAYADFVTAMMAFFLLLWLLATTTKEQKTGIAHYFNPPNNSTEQGGGTGIMGGASVVAVQNSAPNETAALPPVASTDDVAAQAKEDAMFRQVSEELKKAVLNIPELKTMLDNLLIDMTPEGLRITLTDNQQRPLFEYGTAKMFDYTEQMIAVLTSVLSPLSNQLALGGHTDVVPYRGADPAYTNWELSADRAQALRRVMLKEGMVERRVMRVAGFAGQQPLLVDNPASPRNRRLTVIVLRGKQGPIAQFSQDGLLAPQSGVLVP